MSPVLIKWAVRNGIGEKALAELQAIFGISMPTGTATAPAKSEAAVQSLIRLEGARKGLKLWRNNVGALLDSRGVPVRYGLANDSAQLNKSVKSGDLVGWKPVTITPGHVGQQIAQFVSRECKRPGWTYSGDDHERAQLRWIEAVVADGGDACFASGEGTL